MNKEFASVRDILIVALNIIEDSRENGLKLDKDDLRWADMIGRELGPKLEAKLRTIPFKKDDED